MKSILASLSLITLILGGVACQSTNKAPAMRDAVITPSALRPGESAVISVKINDRHNIVDSVMAVVKEDPRVKLKLRDDGIEPDVEAEDDVWTLKVDVPFKAPPGNFTLIIGAYRADGQPIVVHEREAGDVPLAATATVAIRYDDTPAEAEAPAQAVEPAPAVAQPAAPEPPAPAQP